MSKDIILSIDLPIEELLNKVNELKDDYEKNKNSSISPEYDTITIVYPSFYKDDYNKSIIRRLNKK